MFSLAQDKGILHLEDLSSVQDQMNININKPISRATYMNVIKERKVQEIMEELEIFNERVHLFDVLDANGDGKLSLQELVQGLLRLSGEPKKSDVLAAVLGIRAVHDAVQEVTSSLDRLSS